MNCPRCQTQMKEVSIGSARIQLCPNCEGSFYPEGALGEVAEQTKEELEETELAPVLEADQLEKIDLEAALTCPVCGEGMSRYRYLATTDVFLDECLEHGIWLDDGELSNILEYMAERKENSAARRAEIKRMLEEKGVQRIEEMGKSPRRFSISGQFLAGLNRLFARKRR